MSVSVGSAATSPLFSWQQMLQPGNASGSKGQSFDPLADLMNTDAGDASSQAAGGSGAPALPFGQDMMAQLIALQQQASASGNTGATDPGNSKLFAKLDSDGNGSINKSELEAAAGKKGIGASITDAVFAKLDSNGDGSISKDELASADKAGKAGGHHGHGVGGAGGAGDDSSETDGEGTKTTTTVNADQSVTTTITYADGSSASTTSPPPAIANDGSTKNGGGDNEMPKTSGNGGTDLFRQLAELQKQLMSAATTTLSAVV